jgi:3-deoxy-7-phosphoheptulonate synthase
VVAVGSVAVGGPDLVLVAGPCAVESRDQVFRAAEALARAGAHILRGGAFKPRSSPYAFQGLKEEGLAILAAARERFGLPVVTEVMAPGDVEMVAAYADVLQVGSRNMQNFSLLEACGSADRPVLLKRGMSSTIEELLLSAEYVAAAGNPNVILCERGIRTFERQVRNTLDVTAVAVLQDLSHLPVLVDPSHATGKRRYVEAAARAGVAAGADGLIVEVHPCPDEALCDGAQSLTPEGFEGLAESCCAVGRAVGRS